MGAQVERIAPEREVTCQLGEDQGMEAGGVRHQQWLARAAQIVDGDVRPVRRDESRDGLGVGHGRRLTALAA